MTEIAHSQVDHALQRMLSAAGHPRALAIRPEDQAGLHHAIQRAHAQLLGVGEPVLTIALAGCTGAGKSTLINALAGSRIADVSDRRPCTTRTRVYHHRAVPGGGLPTDLAEQAASIAHDRPELRQKVIVDTPDLDTFYTEHRAATCALLKAAGLVIYLFSPERYAEERAWSVIRQEQRFSACLAVLNKADTVAPDILQRIAAEIRQRFASMGKPDIPVLCISSGYHVPDPDGRLPAPQRVTLDEFLTLRAYIEHELQAGDIARMVRQQRSRVLDHLAQQVDRVVPPDAETTLDALRAAARSAAKEAADDLAARMSDALAAMEADLWPLIVVRKHQRFWGPFRTWLSVADFLRYGLPRLVRQLRLLTLPAQEGTPGRLLASGRPDVVTDRLATDAAHLQTLCFDAHLPVERWRAITSTIDGPAVLATASRAVEDRFEALAAGAYRHGRVFPWLISFIAWLMPAGLVIFAAYNLVRQFVEGRPAGLDVVWDLLAMLVLSYLVLHMLTGALMSGRGILPRRSIAAQALTDTLQRTYETWTATYRADLEADIADLREPLHLLRQAAEGTILPDLPAADTSPPAGLAATTPTAAPAQDQDVTPATSATDTESSPESQEALSPAELLRKSMQTNKPTKKP